MENRLCTEVDTPEDLASVKKKLNLQPNPYKGLIYNRREKLCHFSKTKPY